MNTWFTEEKIDSDTIAISEYGHFEHTHSYLLTGSERSLLIDSGLGISNIKAVVEKYTDCKNVMVVATHAHWDHIGGHRFFDDIYVHINEKSWLSDNFPLPLTLVKKNFEENCFLAGKPAWFDCEAYTIYKTDNLKAISDGYIFDLGNRKISCIYAPGHSPGHMCFFDNLKGYLFTGDNIYNGVIYLNYPSTDPVAYKESIDKLYMRRLEFSRLLPAHHNLIIAGGLLEEIKLLLDNVKDENKLRHGAGKIACSGAVIWL